MLNSGQEPRLSEETHHAAHVCYASRLADSIGCINCAPCTLCESSTFFLGTILTSLGETISTIRQRLGKTMVEFARLVGSDHSSVSRYESGQIVPGKTMLILILLLAQGDEKPPLLKALGMRDDGETQQAFEGALESLLEYERLATRSRSRSAKDTGLTEFVKEAVAIANARLSLDPAVAEVLRRLRASNANRRVQAHFRNFLVYLDIALAESKSTVAPTGRNRGHQKHPKR